MKKILLLGMLLSVGWLLGQEILPPEGDLNNDGGVNARDMILLANYLAGNLDTLLTSGDLYTEDSIVGNLRYVASGTFLQGTPGTEPCRVSNEVQFTHTLTRDLLVMEVEVTRSMWAVLRAVQPTLPADQSHVVWSQDLRLPVQKVTWYEALLFANLLSLQQGLSRCYFKNAACTDPLDSSNYTAGPYYCEWDASGYRLPSEAEWEYFCRAGTTTAYWIDEPLYGPAVCQLCPPDPQLTTLNTAAWTCGNSGSRTQPVGYRLANPWNIYDVHGNVVEWCWDWYGIYPTGDQIDYTGPETGTIRTLRAGSWYQPSVAARSGYRSYYQPDGRAYDLGFRLVRNAP